jgi:hypothetical protein
MGITRQREMTKDYIVKLMKFLDDKFTHDQPCVPESMIKKGVIEDTKGDLDPVLKMMTKKRILRYGHYGFADSKIEGYQRGINYKTLYSTLEPLIKASAS